MFFRAYERLPERPLNWRLESDGWGERRQGAQSDEWGGGGWRGNSQEWNNNYYHFFISGSLLAPSSPPPYPATCRKKE